MIKTELPELTIEHLANTWEENIHQYTDLNEITFAVPSKEK